jgi:hypothetical protein
MTRSKNHQFSRSVQLLLALIDQAFDRQSWHGTNLRGSIRGVTAAQAAWRPGRGRHNIWELVVHAAYWKYAVRRRLTGDDRGAFPVRGSNWFVRPERGRGLEADWKADVALLAETHRALRAVIAALGPSHLGARAHGGTTTIGALVTGIAAHDLYHAGQIQLLKRLRSSR